MCAPFCWALRLYWLDTGGGGMPAAEETGDFIAPEAVNRHRMNITKAGYFFLLFKEWIYMSFGCKLEKSFTWLWRWWPIMPIERLCWTRAKPTLVAPHPWLGLGVGGCSNITLLTHVERPVMPGWLLTTWFKYTIYSQQPVGRCCVHVYKVADIWPRVICHMDLWIASSEIRQEQPFQWLIDSVVFLPPQV